MVRFENTLGPFFFFFFFFFGRFDNAIGACEGVEGTGAMAPSLKVICFSQTRKRIHIVRDCAGRNQEVFLTRRKVVAVDYE